MSVFNIGKFESKLKSHILTHEKKKKNIGQTPLESPRYSGPFIVYFLQVFAHSGVHITNFTVGKYLKGITLLDFKELFAQRFIVFDDLHMQIL